MKQIQRPMQSIHRMNAPAVAVNPCDRQKPPSPWDALLPRSAVSVPLWLRAIGAWMADFAGRLGRLGDLSIWLASIGPARPHRVSRTTRPQKGPAHDAAQQSQH